MKSRPLSFCVILLVVSAALAGCNRAPARTDAQMAVEVQGTIVRDTNIAGQEIEVQTDHGVVTLSGAVSTEEGRILAAQDAAKVEGVKTVINNLVVQPIPVTTAQEIPAVSQSAPSSSKRSLQPRATAGTSTVAGLPKAGGNLSGDPVNSLPPPPAEPAVAQAPPPPPPPKKFTIPAGTQLTVRLNDGLDTERNQVGDAFHATLGAPIVMDDQTVIPSGADIVGRVVDVKSAGRFAGNSVLTLELNSLSVNGRTYNIQTNQWSRQGKGEGKNTAVKAGGGAAVGAIIGGLAGGGKGAAIGSVAGAGAGTGVAATKKGEQIKLAPEASLSFLLINTLTVTQQSANDRNAGRTPLQ